MKIVIKSLLLIALCILTSCADKKEKYDSNGNLIAEYELINNKISGEYKEFYKDGKLKVIHNYRDGINVASAYYNAQKEIVVMKKYLPNDTIYEKQFDNSILIAEGKHRLKNQLGLWRYYRKNGSLEKILEYVNLCGHQYTNQGWNFDENGKFKPNEGNYFEISKAKKIYKREELILITIKYKPLSSNNAQSTIFYHPSLDSRFCNRNEIKLDSRDPESKNEFILKVTFSTTGNKNLRGFISELYDTGNGSENGERLVYFDIPLIIE